MALTAAQKELRRLIKRAETRRKRLERAGIESPALERALAALGGATSFNLGKNPTKSWEMVLKRVVKRFLKAETSTISGYKRVEKKRRAGIIQMFKDRGITASEDDVDKALKGAPTFSHIAEIYGITSDVVATEYARGAQEGKTTSEVEQEIAKVYKPNPNIEAREMTEGESGTETAYRPLTKEERQTARERREEIFEDIDEADVGELFDLPKK